MDNLRIVVSGTGLLPRSARRTAFLTKACREAIRLERAKLRGELNIVFVDRRRMKELNKEFLGKSHDTDVIAFRYDESPGPDGPFGDVFISAYMLPRQAKEVGHSALEEALILIAHGTLHLLGYDDARKRGRERMFAKQAKVVQTVLA